MARELVHGLAAGIAPRPARAREGVRALFATSEALPAGADLTRTWTIASISAGAMDQRGGAAVAGVREAEADGGPDDAGVVASDALDRGVEAVRLAARHTRASACAKELSDSTRDGAGGARRVAGARIHVAPVGLGRRRVRRPLDVLLIDAKDRRASARRRQ